MPFSKFVLLVVGALSIPATNASATTSVSFVGMSTGSVFTLFINSDMDNSSNIMGADWAGLNLPDDLAVSQGIFPSFLLASSVQSGGVVQDTRLGNQGLFFSRGRGSSPGNASLLLGDSVAFGFDLPGDIPARVDTSFRPLYEVVAESVSFSGEWNPLVGLVDLSTEIAISTLFQSVAKGNAVFTANYEWSSQVSWSYFENQVSPSNLCPYGVSFDCHGIVLSAAYHALSNAGLPSGAFSEEMRIHSINGIQVTPIPEPETYAMMLAGLGLIGAMTRRRKQKLNV